MNDRWDNYLMHYGRKGMEWGKHKYAVKEAANKIKSGVSEFISNEKNGMSKQDRSNYVNSARDNANQKKNQLDKADKESSKALSSYTSAYAKSWKAKTDAKNNSNDMTGKNIRQEKNIKASSNAAEKAYSNYTEKINAYENAYDEYKAANQELVKAASIPVSYTKTVTKAAKDATDSIIEEFGQIKTSALTTISNTKNKIASKFKKSSNSQLQTQKTKNGYFTLDPSTGTTVFVNPDGSIKKK